MLTKQTCNTTNCCAYGAEEYGGKSAAGATASQEQRVRAETGAKVELVEEQLTARTRPVHTGEVTIRREVVTETRTIEVPVRTSGAGHRASPG